jgi:serine protease AprX
MTWCKKSAHLHVCTFAHLFSRYLFNAVPLMLRRIFIGILCFISFAGEMHAQKAYWIFFTDKNGTSFDPYSYFAPEAIARRQKSGISLYDSTDFPVNENYIAQVGKIVEHVGYSTRWFNGIGVDATDDEIISVQKLSFVREVVQQADWIVNPASVADSPDTNNTLLVDLDRDIRQQIDPMNGYAFAKNNITGKGIIISIIDVGFHGTDISPAFKQLRFDNRIRATFDFSKDNADVYGPSPDHGTMVLSCIAGFSGQTQLGLAPDAIFLLAKISSGFTSQPHGEENFVKAMEWSDQQGAMIINVSDGPDKGTYFPEQMDGKKSLMSRASNLAAKKGMLVIAAAGNEGESSEPNLLPPADADSVLSVTALNDKGYIASYSSYGPPPDFRRKPDVCAPGTAIVANGNGKLEVEDGTSFSAPLLAGFAACVIQKYPDLTPMMLADTMRRCSSQYPYYDYSQGYGTPQASYFFETKKTISPTFKIQQDSGVVKIKINPENLPDCHNHGGELLFYNLEDSKGRIYKYEVINISDNDTVQFDLDDVRVGFKLHVFYKGYYATENF